MQSEFTIRLVYSGTVRVASRTLTLYPLPPPPVSSRFRVAIASSSARPLSRIDYGSARLLLIRAAAAIHIPTRLLAA
ncbi:hypothetical protein OPV22_010796 [Ensete ventricosum]|uniref:Uncharacterized protein n=1 Tax=Ensete ventricosum TaxID=4639 RepID=A0AAV8PWN5_ENSVE|nr:hypothetical protein OPV22_010796 [Ensete ventricosum]